MNKVAKDVEAALSGIEDGATIAIGGFFAAGVPRILLRALIAKGVKNLTLACGSGPLLGAKDELSALVKKKKRGRPIDKQESLYLKSAHKAASLVHSYEKLAVLAMNARGVGPRTAARLLDLNLTEDELYKEILNAEREFVRTSKFWRK